MCGIAGIYHLETAKPVDPARLRAMLSPMQHRGPDGAGEWTAAEAHGFSKMLALPGIFYTRAGEQ